MKQTNLFCWLCAFLNHFDYAIGYWMYGLQSRWNWEQTPVRERERAKNSNFLICFGSHSARGFVTCWIFSAVFILKIESCSHYYLSRWNHAFHQDNLIFLLLYVCVVCVFAKSHFDFHKYFALSLFHSLIDVQAAFCQHFISF